MTTTKNVMAITIIALITLIGCILTSTTSFSAKADEVVFVEDLYGYYDLNRDGKVSVSDLAEAKRLLEYDDKLSAKDVYFIRQFLINGQWPEEMSFQEIDIDDMIYNQETIDIIDNMSAGLIVDVQKEFPDVTSGSVRIRILNDATVKEIRCSSMEMEIAYPIVWAYNFENQHIAVSVTESGNLIWDHWAFYIETDAEMDRWITTYESLSKYYDFDLDGEITVYDFVIAKQLAFDSDKLSLNDVLALEDFLLTGKWDNEFGYIETDLDDYSYSDELNEVITAYTYGQFVDHKIQEDNIRMRFLNDCTICEIRLGRKGNIVLPIKYMENKGHKIVLGFTDDGLLAWDMCYEQIPELF